jgi:C-methyltransferase C-terminal domain/Putative zinc binding domain
MTGCRGCRARRVHRVLDLGRVPAADLFPPAGTPVRPEESSYRLAMALCPFCGLAQLAEDDTIAEEPRGLEPRALREQAALAVQRVAEAGWFPDRPQSTVREFGSPHGGTWLPLMIERGLTPVTGAAAADVVLDSFGVMHEPDQAAAFRLRAAATAADGVLLLQYHSLAAIVARQQWNAVRHGHFAYYSMAALTRLFAGAEMSPVTAWEFDLYGGTVLVAAVHGRVEPDKSVRQVLASEAPFVVLAGVSSLQEAADRRSQGLRNWLESEQDAGRRVYAYGASSRAVALFQLAGIDRRLIVAVADASPVKQGRRMPGTDVPIIAPRELVAANPDRVFLTLAELRDEVAEQMPSLTGRWITDEVTAR